MRLRVAAAAASGCGRPRGVTGGWSAQQQHAWLGQCRVKHDSSSSSSMRRGVWKDHRGARRLVRAAARRLGG
jgi:hypothetical protein